MPEPSSRRLRQPPASAYVTFFFLFLAILLPAHAWFLRVPYYWDEAGQFIPAAMDILREGRLVPRTATPNVHPPGVMLFLAGVWSIAGHSIIATRTAMLVVAAAAALCAFLLAIELARDSRGTPALLAVGLLLASPWFFSQSMMAQLDMPAMLFTALALLLFLQNRMRSAAAACCALVLVKETGALVPAVFLLWLAWERRFREAALFAAPFALLAAWLAYLAAQTGHVLGNQEFARYNLAYPLHPVRAALALLRRLYSLGIGSFHWVGAIAICIALRRSRIFRSRAWKIAAAVAAAHVLAFSFVGGAALERYLLPVLPIVYIAMAIAWRQWRKPWRYVAPALGLGGLLASNFIDPPYPFPYENNLAWTRFVRLHQEAAAYVQHEHPAETIATAWPLADALRRPYLGYVSVPLRVERLPDFRRATLDAAAAKYNVVVVFTLHRRTAFDSAPGDFVRTIWRRYYDFEPQAPPLYLTDRMVREEAWSRGDLWVEVYGAQRNQPPPERAGGRKRAIGDSDGLSATGLP